MIFQKVWENQISYLDSLKKQEELKAECLKTGRSFALGFHCPAVITLGLRGSEEDLLFSQSEYKKKNISIISIKRGGQATLHSPGQLVLYPISNIKQNKFRVRDFVHFIEQTTRQVFTQLGVSVHKEEGQAGLFTQRGKIAFFGIHITEGVSQHGLAVNIHNDLSLFDSIRSCGVSRRTHDKLSNYCNITVQDFFNLWIKTIKKTEYSPKVSTPAFSPRQRN